MAWVSRFVEGRRGGGGEGGFGACVLPRVLHLALKVTCHEIFHFEAQGLLLEMKNANLAELYWNIF
jgi:hypothetical protein